MPYQPILLISYAILWVVVILLCVLSLVMLRYLGLVLGQSGRLNPLMPTIVDRQLPDVSLIDPAGLSVTPSGLGGPLFILALSTGCLQCNQLLSATAELLEGVAAKGTKILLVLKSADQDSVDELRRVHRISTRIPIWRDPNGVTAKAWDIQVMPTAMVIDASMQVKWVARQPTPDWVKSVIGRSIDEGENLPDRHNDVHSDNNASSDRKRILVKEPVSNG